MTANFDFAKASIRARSDCISAIHGIIFSAGCLKAFCAGDYLRNVLIFDDNAEDCRVFKTVDLYFPDKEAIAKFVNKYSELQCSPLPDVYFLVKFDQNIATIVFHLIQDYKVNFDIDRLVYLKDSIMDYHFDKCVDIDLSLHKVLEEQIIKKQARAYRDYVFDAIEKNDYRAYIELMRDEFSLYGSGNLCGAASGDPLFVGNKTDSVEELIKKFHEAYHSLIGISFKKSSKRAKISTEKLNDVTEKINLLRVKIAESAKLIATYSEEIAQLSLELKYN